MKLKHTLMLTALTIALNGVLVAHAADGKPATDAKAEKVQPAIKDKGSDKAASKKQGTAGKVEDTCCRNLPPADKKSAHDHR